MAVTKIDAKKNASAVAELPARTEKTYEGLTRQQLVETYRLMYLSRRIDDKEKVLKNQQKTFFQISSAGHEALAVAAALNLKAGYDWFYPYYRDRTLCLALGMTPYEQLLEGVGAADDPNSGGRQMPSHWGHKKLNLVTQSSPTGTQCLQAVGCAEAGQYFGKHPEAAEKHEGDYRQFKDVRFQGDEVVYCSAGDGTTSEGEFWEAMNSACNLKLPVLFLIEDNGYAISVPVDVQTAGGNVAQLVKNFPNLHWVGEIDGNDPIESYGILREAVEHCRARKGPAFVRALVTRPYSHSMSDDATKYRSKAEREAETEKDCLRTFARFLIDEGVAEQAALDRMAEEVQAELRQASDDVLGAPQPPLHTATAFVFSPDVDPTSDRFAVEPRIDAAQAPETMLQNINYCLRDEMKRNPRIEIGRAH